MNMNPKQTGSAWRRSWLRPATLQPGICRSWPCSRSTRRVRRLVVSWTRATASRTQFPSTRVSRSRTPSAALTWRDAVWQPW